MQERDTVQCGACGEAVPPNAATCTNCGTPLQAVSLYSPEPAPSTPATESSDEALPPLPPPPPVGADMPQGEEEEVPDDAFELPPTPVSGALWPGMAPEAAAAESDDEEEDLAKLFEHGINAGEPVPANPPVALAEPSDAPPVPEPAEPAEPSPQADEPAYEPARAFDPAPPYEPAAFRPDSAYGSAVEQGPP